MRRFFRKAISLLLLAAMIMTMVPMNAFAKHRESDGYPEDLTGRVILALNKDTKFPGEPSSIFDISMYTSFDSGFNQKSLGSAYYATSAEDVLKPDILNAVVEGAPNTDWYGNVCYVWGVFSTSTTDSDDSLAKYFIDGKNNPIFTRANEEKMLKAAGIRTNQLDNYEIIWYVVKYQTSDSCWHIDGIVHEKEKYSVNYYGNGANDGSAPVGATNLTSGSDYRISRNSGNLQRVVAGVTYQFTGWNTKPDGTGTHYDVNEVIKVNDQNFPDHTLSLYAEWYADIKYNATVNLYLDGARVDLDVIHPNVDTLMISKDGVNFIDLTKTGTGVYTGVVTSNGQYALYHDEDEGAHRIGDSTIPIYNQDGAIDEHHYSVNYDSKDGDFPDSKTDASYRTIHLAGATDAKVTADVPALAGHRFIGWNTSANGNGTIYQPGDSLPAVNSKLTLYAQYVKLVDVKINVTIDHRDGSALSYDENNTKDEVTVELAVSNDGGQSYVRVPDGAINLHDGITEKFNVSTVEAGGITEETRYTANGATFTGLDGGSAKYSVITRKTNYDVKSINATQDNSGNWTIDVVLVFNPTSQDLTFSARTLNIPESLYPKTVVAKVLFWNPETDTWDVIVQHVGQPGSRIDINAETGYGSASYPVWSVDKYSEPYGYRIEVTSFVYPDGTISTATPVAGSNKTKWTDGVYTATLDANISGTNKVFGTTGLEGAFFSSVGQNGILDATITMDIYDVVFHANHHDATINGGDTYTLEDQYKIPALGSYVPVCGEPGHLFDGWYLDAACTQPATEGADLTSDMADRNGIVHLYAKWKEPITISGTVEIAGTYQMGGNTVDINPVDRADKALVVLEQVGVLGAKAQQELTFNYSGDPAVATAEYSFTVPDDGTKYEVMTRVLNYSTAYNNEPINDNNYVVIDDLNDAENSANDAIDADGNKDADVNIKLAFDPDSYIQQVIVDADAIGDGFRPHRAVAVIRYRDLDDNHHPDDISQHDLENGGTGGIDMQLATDLDSNGVAAEGQGSESIWKYHFDGGIYEYSAGLNKLYGNDGAYNSDGSINFVTAPYHLLTSAATSWDRTSGTVIGGTVIGRESGVLKVTVLPNQYGVEFLLNAGSDTVTGMDDYKTTETEVVDGETVPVYKTTYLWSYGTDINARPVREHYNFLGWFEDKDGDELKGANESYVTEIAASEHRDITLIADWELKTYTVTYTDGVAGTAFTDKVYNDCVYGDDTPDFGNSVPSRDGHVFTGWSPEVDDKVTGNATYVALWAETYTVTYTDGVGGTVFGNDVHSGLVAGSNTPGYTDGTPTRTGHEFTGWTPKVAAKVTGNATYAATWEPLKYTVTWLNEGGAQLEKDTDVPYGTMPHYDGDVPAKASTAQYTYTFKGWDKTLEPVTGNVTYTATFSETTNKYTVTFVDDNGTTVLGTGTYEYGATPVAPSDPTKASDAQYTYTFAGWTPGVVSVTGNATYKATYTPTLRSYTVVWKNHDGTVLETDTNVPYGTTPTYDAEQKPVKTPEENDTRIYHFNGWTPTITMVTGDAEYTAIFNAEDTYTVTYTDGVPGEVIFRDQTTSGLVIDADTPDFAGTPTRDGYEFTGWSPNKSDKVAGNATYTAQWEAIVYTVNWYNEDGSSLIATKNYYYDDPVIRPANPEKQDTAEYDYSFAGWKVKDGNGEVVEIPGTVRADADYVATFSRTKQVYTVTFVDENGTTVLGSGTYEYGADPEVPSDPSKGEDAQYTYTFAGWTPGVVSVTGDATYRATYTPTLRNYTVTWLNEGGAQLEQDTKVPYGTMPEYNGSTPQKASDVRYSYTFKDWDKNRVPVTGDVVYTAVYDSTPVIYTVTYTDGVGGTAFENVQHTAKYEDAIPAFGTGDPTRPGYTFKGWDTDLNGTVTGDMTIEAKWEAIDYTVTWRNDDGSVLGTGTYHYGDMPAYTGTPTKAATAQYTYTFKGWTPTVTAVTGNATYTATYDAVVNTYTVTWLNDDDAQLEQDTKVPYGTMPEYNGTTPEKADTDEFNYEFSHWDPIVVTVTGDATYKAVYTKTLRSYTVTWLDEDNSELAEKTYNYGEMPEYPGAEPTKASTAEFDFSFSGWTPTVEKVTRNAVYKALYSETTRKYTVTYTDGVDGEDVFGTETHGNVAYGTETPEFTGTPTRTGYTFKGWGPAVADTVAGDAVYEAQWERIIYTVTWVDEDNTELAEKTYFYGDMPEYPGAEPTKASTSEFDFSFSGWSPTVEKVTRNAVYKALYSETTRKYTVTYTDGVDGEDVFGTETHGNVAYGTETPEFTGTPTRTGYTFKGWGPAVADTVTGHAVYEAQWEPIIYTVKWVNEDGTVLETDSCTYGETPEYNGTTPSKAATAYHTFTFHGWDKTVTPVTEDATYTAEYIAVGISVSRDPSENPSTGVRMFIGR